MKLVSQTITSTDQLSRYIKQTFDEFLGAFSVFLYEERRGQEERSSQHTDETRHVQRVLQTQVLNKQVVTAIRCHYQVT